MPNNFNYHQHFRDHFYSLTFDQQGYQAELLSSTSATSNPTPPSQTTGQLSALSSFQSNNNSFTLPHLQINPLTQQPFQIIGNNIVEFPNSNQSAYNLNNNLISTADQKIYHMPPLTSLLSNTNNNNVVTPGLSKDSINGESTAISSVGIPSLSQPTTIQKTPFLKADTASNIVRARGEEFDLIYSAATEDGYPWSLKDYLEDISAKCDTVHAEGKGKVIDHPQPQIKQFKTHSISEFDIQLDFPEKEKRVLTVWRQLYQGKVIDICIAPLEKTDIPKTIKAMRKKVPLNASEKIRKKRLSKGRKTNATSSLSTEVPSQFLSEFRVELPNITSAFK